MKRHITSPTINPSYMAIFTASVGGLLEMYDFTIYAFLAPTINYLFFEPLVSSHSMILTFATFAIGYLVRPIGGIYFGHIGDKIGRRSGLLITILLMGIATFLIGCLGTYQQIGYAAPIALVVLRIIQGIAVGGDLPGGMTYLSEQAAEHRCGRYMGYLFAGINMGSLLACGVVFLLTHLMPHALFLTWGWRMAFWGSIALTVVGLMHRRNLNESPAFLQLQQQKSLARVPSLYLLKVHRRELIQSLLLLFPFIVIVSQLFVYTPTYLHHFYAASYDKALRINTLGIICYVIALKTTGFVSDRVGHRRMIQWFIPLIALAGVGYYQLLGAGYWVTATVFMSLFCGVCSVSILSAFTQLFPPAIRYTGIAIAYNLLFAIGGLIPMLLTVIIPLAHQPNSVPPVLLILGAVSLGAYILLSGQLKPEVEKKTVLQS